MCRDLKVPQISTLKSRMAQKRENEQATETELKVPETLTLCVQTCGFSASDKPRSRSPSPPDDPDSTLENSDQGAVRRREVNRCSGCKRKLGLIGFRCRCGEMFCSKHRYSDRHECRFDYKAAGREMIAKENPVVRPAKILKV
ncbi:unnamed protein product, partial [Vitis vinifera]|uniref:AN1-type domain-containing protein n=3 Tax=Vitis vinifera TaxID=29760 RepID=D7SL83_VITVI